MTLSKQLRQLQGSLFQLWAAIHNFLHLIICQSKLQWLVSLPPHLEYNSLLARCYPCCMLSCQFANQEYCSRSESASSAIVSLASQSASFRKPYIPANEASIILHSVRTNTHGLPGRRSSSRLDKLSFKSNHCSRHRSKDTCQHMSP